MENVLEDWTTIIQEDYLESIDFKPEEITKILLDMGLVRENENCRIEDMERYIFLYGNDQETYGLEERSFIECVGTVYIYNNFNRKTSKGTIATNIYGVDLCQFEDSVRSCFLFMKLINKAFDNFNVFFFKTTNGLFLGCRLYDKDESKNCTLSEAIKTERKYEEMMENLFNQPNTDLFIPYYEYLVDVIESRNTIFIDYDLKISIRRGVNFSYLESLSDIENNCHLSTNYAKELYFQTFETNFETQTTDEYKTVTESLKFIKSQRMNTLEMLFDADEVLSIADRIEQETQNTLNSEYEKSMYTSAEEEIMQYINDPEKIIKMLKEKGSLLY